MRRRSDVHGPPEKEGLTATHRASAPKLSNGKTRPRRRSGARGHRPNNESTQKPRKPLMRVLRVAFPGFVAAGMIWVAFSSAGGIADAIELIDKVSLGWIFVALACEGASYLALALMLRHLAGSRENVRRLAPFRLALVVFGLGNVLPAAPAEGLVMAGAALRRRGLAKRRAVLALGLSQYFRAGSFLAIGAINALIVLTVERIDVPDRTLLIVVASLSLVTLVSVGWLSTRTAAAEWAAIAAERIRPWKPRSSPSETRQRAASWHAAVSHIVSGPSGLLYLTATTAAAWLADAGCLHFALVAFNVHVSLAVLLFAYTAGEVASMAPLMPGGFGIVETVVPAVLGLAHVRLVVALAAIIVYRAVATILPAVAGVLALIGLRAEDSADTELAT